MPNEPEIHAHEEITEGKVVEKSKLEKALSLFIAEDMNTVTDSIMDDYIKPRMKQFGKEARLKFLQFIADSLKGCVDIVILGNNKKSSGSGSYGTYKNYSVYYSDEYGSSSKSYSYETDDYGFKLITLPSYGKAQEVLTELMSIVKRYQKASVADYYVLTKIGVSSVDYNYGWTIDLSKSKIIPYRDGYLIDLPRPKPL